MARNAYSLAAVAAASVPGLDPVSTAAIPTPLPDLDVAGVVARDGRRVLVSSPRTLEASVRMERDLAVAEVLASGPLTGLVPSVLGSVKLAGGGRAAVTDVFAGAPLSFDALMADGDLAAALGRTLAQIHEVPAALVERAGVESYTAAALRAHHEAQVARARATGAVPTAVAQRWAAALDDAPLWHFEPVLVHADLSEEALFAREGRITGVRGWSSARIGDPATDLAWLVSTLEPEVLERLIEAYRAARTGGTDARLLERAQVLAELAVADWLLHGADTEDQVILDDARGMLADLDAEIAAQARAEAEAAYADLDEHVPDRQAD